MVDIASWRGSGRQTPVYSQLRIPWTTRRDGASSSAVAAVVHRDEVDMGVVPAEAEALSGEAESLYELPGSDLSDEFISPVAPDGSGSLRDFSSSSELAFLGVFGQRGHGLLRRTLPCPRLDTHVGHQTSVLDASGAHHNPLIWISQKIRAILVAFRGVGES